MSNKRCIKTRLQYLQRSYKASEAISRATCFALLQRLSWLTCLIPAFRFFCLNNIIPFSNAGFKRKMVWKWRFLLIHKQQTNLWMKLPTIPPGLAGKIVKYRPLSEPIRLQDLEDSARSQAWKKINIFLSVSVNLWHNKFCKQNTAMLIVLREI